MSNTFPWFRASSGLTLCAALQYACAGADGGDGSAEVADPTALASPSTCFDLPGTGAKAEEAGPVRKGIMAQGITAQGITAQGITAQGMTSQGLSTQGLSYQGLMTQGARAQGIGSQGFSGQGLTAQGTALQRAEFRLSALNGVELSLAGQRLSLDRGVLVAPEPLPGSTLDALSADGRTFALRIDRVENSGELSRYGLSAFDQPVCADDELGIFITGAWSDSGEHLASDTTLTYACQSGVLQKCVAWGYAPWQVGDSYYQACTRLARADYCGDGQSWTREHTLVNIYDGIGVQVSDPGAGFSFEAAWGPGGAVCVNDVRYRVRDADGSPLLPSCWAELPRCQSFEAAGFAAALIANDSEHAQIQACAR